MADAAPATEQKVVEIRLRDGETVEAHVDASEADLAGLHRSLTESEFVRVGDDTIVRAEEVRYVRVREGRSGNLLESLVSRVGGGDDAGDKRREQTTRRPEPARVYRETAEIETKPFFLTSEFVLAFAAWVALLLTTLATDSLDAPLFLLLTVALAAGYMLSRGFAKAHTPSGAWDPRDELRV